MDKILKTQKTKLLKSNPGNLEQFEKIQNKLDTIEFLQIIEENSNHIPNIN